MRIHTLATGVCAALLTISGVARADFANGPDPYSAGFGFDRPDDATATWGGWTRGDSGTLWAEWDQFSGGANPKAPDVGSSGTSSASFAWNAGTFPAGSGNLYNFQGVEIFTLHLAASSSPAAGPLTVALQTETWGTPLEFDSLGDAVTPVKLNGAQWDAKVITYQNESFASSFGPVLLEHVLYTWTLSGPLASYDFVLQGGPHMSFAQAAVDIGASPVPVPAAAWLLGTAMAGLFGAKRRRAAR